MIVSNDSPIAHVIHEFEQRYPWCGQSRIGFPDRETTREVYRVEDSVKAAQKIRYKGGQTGEEFVNNAFERGDRLEKIEVGCIKRNMMVNPDGTRWQVPANLLPYVQVVMQYGRMK